MELRLDINGDLMRSEVFKDLRAWAAAAVAWKPAMMAKGRQEPPPEEKVRLV